MPVILQFDFSHAGPFAEDLAETMQELARSIAEEPGLLWKIWTENADTQEAGGIYLFDNRALALAYKNKHEKRLMEFGYTAIKAKIFEVNEILSGIDRAPLPVSAGNAK